MPKIDLENVPVLSRIVYPEPFRNATEGYEQQRVGDAAGLTKMGINRVVLPPRSRTALLHWHEVDDEFVIIISGEVVLREEGGETVLVAGDCAGFKAGVANGHALENRQDEPAILFEIGTRDEVETVHYPEVDLRYEKRNGERGFVHRDGTPYPTE
jgi:uncharacterized cupin superfamily protein